MYQFRQWIGIEIDPVSIKEKAVSMVGGFLSILIILAVSQYALRLSGASMLITSMGASAVLLFAVPHGQLSQPWPVIGSHLLCATLGVTCARFIGTGAFAAACAVGLAIGVMHQLKCIHPPGGATALAAVLGGPAVHALGYSFVLFPVLVNALAIVTVAIGFNYAFAWRRYPAHFNHTPREEDESREFSHDEVVAALRSLDSFVDITEEDLVRLCHILATNHAMPTVSGGTET